MSFDTPYDDFVCSDLYDEKTMPSVYKFEEQREKFIEDAFDSLLDKITNSEIYAKLEEFIDLQEVEIKSREAVEEDIYSAENQYFSIYGANEGKNITNDVLSKANSYCKDLCYKYMLYIHTIVKPIQNK
jgi:hypothetical protein